MTPVRRATALGLSLLLGTAGLLAVGALPARAASTTTLTVTTTADIGPTAGACGNSSTSVPSPLSLREATCLANNIAAASPGDTVAIQLPAGTYTLANGELAVGTVQGSRVSLTGTGAASTIIDGNNGNRVLNIDSLSLGDVQATVTGLTITGGRNTDGYGGAGILAGAGGEAATGDTLTLDAVTVSGNQVITPLTNAPGAGVQFQGGTLSITGSSFSGNGSAASPGAAVYYFGQGTSGESLTVTGSTFSTNTASASVAGVPNGGALTAGSVNAATPVSVTDNVFTGNAVTASNGRAVGAAVWAQSGTATVARNTFTGNSVSGGTSPAGSAVFVESATGTVQDNRITGNTGAAVASSGALDATNNWWGCNAGPGNADCDTTSGSVTSTPRLTLTAAATPATVNTGATSAVSAGFLTNSAGAAITASRLTAFAGQTIAWGSATPSGASAAPSSSTIASGAATTTYTAGGTTGAGQVVATFGTQTATAALTVTTPPAPPAVTTNPTDQTVQPGTSVSFTSAASGSPTPTVQWQRSTDGGAGFVNIAGATSATYTFTASIGDDGNQYRAVWTNPSSAATTTAATLHVGTAPAFTSTDHTTFQVGAAGSFTITTSGQPSATLSRTGAQFPAWLTLTDNGDGTGALTGTPPAGSAGQYQFTLKAANGFSPSASQVFTLQIHEAPVITSANHATFQNGTAGSFTVTTAGGYPGPAQLSVTGSLPSGVTFIDNGDGTATLAGTPTQSGTFPISLSASGSGSIAAPATQSFTLTVNAAPVITSADHATFAVGAAGAFTVTTAAGNPAATTLTEAGTLPAGMTFTDNGDGTATLAGTPAGGTGGSYALTLTASNGVLPNSSQAFTLSVLEPTTITSANAATFTTASAGSFTVTTAGGYPAPAVLSETGALPAGLSFTDNGDGTATLAGTPAAGTGGTYSVTLTANNGVAPNATQSFTLTVNAPPTITSADHATFSVGTTGSFTVTTTPGTPSATTLTLLAGSLPTGVTFVDNGDGTATLSGTPAAGTGGTHAVTVSASNGVPSDATQSFTLTVTELAGITSAPTATFTTGTAGSFTVTTTAGFPTATTLTETGALPGGLTFTDNGDGTATLAGTPVSGSGGTYSLTLTATNSAGGTSQSFTLTVDEPPTITSVDQATFEVGTAGSFTVTTSAGNPTATVVSLTGTLPSGVAFVDNGDGTATLSGTPATGTGGTYVTSLTASNGIAPDATQSFTLTVEETAGITSSDATTFTVGSAGTFTVTSSAGFPPGTTLTRTGALPAGVTFTDNGDGTATLAGTPAAGEGGSYALTLKATNSVGTTSQAFTLTVQELSSFTSSATHTFTAGVAGTFSVTTTGGFPTPPALTSSGDLPDGVTFVDDGDGTATLAGTPAAGGTYALVLTATTAAGPVTQSFTLTVNGPPSITSDPAVTFTAGVATTYDVVSRAGIPTATSLTVAGALPAGVTFTDDGDGTGRLSGTAGSDAVGSYPLTVTASNGVDPDATQAFTLTVVLAGAVALPDTLPPSDGALLGVPQTAVAGSPITVTGTNFAAGATVTLGLYSTPTALGTAQANGVGTFTKTLTLPSITGTHTVVAAGIGKDGTVQYLSSTIVLTAPAPAKASGGAALAVTGSLVDPVRGATLGLLLMLSGAGLVYGFRRRA